MQAKLLADTPISPGSPPLREHPNAITASGPFSSLSPPTSIPALPPSVNPAQPNDTSITSSIILSPKESTEKKRTRAGSASGTGGDNKPKDVFNDLAAQSKKGFNAILQKFGGDKDRDRDDLPVISTLDLEGGSGLQRRGTGARGDPARGMGTMRGVKVKRDADEAGRSCSVFRVVVEPALTMTQTKHTDMPSSISNHFVSGEINCRPLLQR